MLFHAEQGLENLQAYLRMASFPHGQRRRRTWAIALGVLSKQASSIRQLSSVWFYPCRVPIPNRCCLSIQSFPEVAGWPNEVVLPISLANAQITSLPPDILAFMLKQQPRIWEVIFTEILKPELKSS